MSPAGLSDTELAQALLPEFNGDQPGVIEDERTVLKASAPLSQGRGEFWRLLDTDVPECRRAVAWLRGTAFEASRLDPQARIAGATYVTRPTNDPVTLELLDETAVDPFEHASEALADASA